MIRLFTDTDTDITPKEAKKYGYTLISMPYSINGKTVYPYRDSEDFDLHRFYEELRGGAVPTTSAISREAYRQYFEPVFAAGDDIFYVHFSKAMSTTFHAMNQALEELYQIYPGRKCYTVDTRGIMILSYCIVKEVGKLFADGKTVEEVLSWTKQEVGHFALYAYAGDLTFIRRSGRVSGFAATMGTILGVHPIFCFNGEGKIEIIRKERGRVRAMESLVEKVSELGDRIGEYTLVVGHTDAEESAREVGEMLRERFGENLNIEFITVNPTAGCHCGPDGVGISFHAVHR